MPEDELLEALKGLGADHEPDVAAIRRRMDDRSVVVPLVRADRPAHRRRPVLLSAAAALLVGGGVTVAVSQASPDPNQTPANRVPVLIPSIDVPDDSPTTSAKPRPSRVPSDPTPDGVSTSTSRKNDSKDAKPSSADETTKTAENPETPKAPRTNDVTPGGPGSEPEASTSLSPLEDGKRLTLGSSDDWLAIGTRNDLKTVRSKTAPAPLLRFDVPPTAASVDGPFKLSWTGGIPEQDRTDTTRWMQTDGAVVTVTASTAARTVTLYTGNALNLTVSGPGLKPHNLTLPDDERGYAVKISIPSHSGDTTIKLESGRGPVHLLAVTAAG